MFGYITEVQVCIKVIVLPYGPSWGEQSLLYPKFVAVSISTKPLQLVSSHDEAKSTA